MSNTQAKIAALQNNTRFQELRRKAIESEVVFSDNSDLPGSTHKGYYYDSNDDSGVFKTTAEIDEYLNLLRNGAEHR